MEHFYNFVNCYYNKVEGTLLLPVGFGRKNKYLPDISNVNSEDMEKYSPIRELSVIKEGTRMEVFVLASDNDEMLGISLMPLHKKPIPEDNCFSNTGAVYVTAKIYKNILSVEIPAYFASPFIENHLSDEPIRRFEVWFFNPLSKRDAGVIYYPIQRGRFATMSQSAVYAHMGQLDKFLGDEYGKTL